MRPLRDRFEIGQSIVSLARLKRASFAARVFIVDVQPEA